MEYAIAGIAIVGFIYFAAYKLSQKVERERPVVTPRPRPGVDRNEK